MPPLTCTRHLSRSIPEAITSSPPWQSHLPCRAAFSTSTRLSALPAKRSGPPSTVPKRGDVRFKMKKNIVKATGKKPGIGERKALRKRIILSNTNAIEVPDMVDLAPENMADGDVQGKVLGLPGDIVDSLRAVEAFKPTQGFNLFRRPAVLMREESVRIGRVVKDIAEAEKPKSVRRVLVGEKGSGKTTLLLQSLAMAFASKWVVINIPDAMEVTNAHTRYAPIPDTNPPIYFQKDYTMILLSQIVKANKAVLSQMTVSKKHDLPIPLQENISLDRLAEHGARNADIAWPVFQALWTELTVPSQEGKGLQRPPVMLALDQLQHVMVPSKYESPDLKPIHAHDLALVNIFMKYLSGARTLPNGGIILAATSESNEPACPSLKFAIELNTAASSGTAADKLPQWNPYKKVDERVLQAMDGVDVMLLRGLSRDEARGIMEYYARSGMLRQQVTDGLIGEKWTLSGGGIIGELEKNTVKLRI